MRITRLYFSIKILWLAGLATFVLGIATLANAASLDSVKLHPTNQSLMQDLIGVWEGSWYADQGDQDSFQLTIRIVDQEGYVSGSRMYISPYGSYDVRTEGYITDGQLYLDTNRGEDSWIKLRLYKDIETGELKLNGRYSTVGGGSVFLGDIRTKKVSSPAAQSGKECPLCDLKLQNPDSAKGLDIDATARKLIAEWGDYAALEATNKADSSEDVGDLNSKTTWLKIRARIEALQKP